MISHSNSAATDNRNDFSQLINVGEENQEALVFLFAAQQALINDNEKQIASVLRDILPTAKRNYDLYSGVAALALRLAESEDRKVFRLAITSLKEVVDNRRGLDEIGKEAFSGYVALAMESASSKKDFSLFTEIFESPFYSEVSRLDRKNVLFNLLNRIEECDPAEAVPAVHLAVAKTPEDMRNRELLSNRLVDLAKKLDAPERNEVFGYILAHPNHAAAAKKEVAYHLGVSAGRWAYGTAMAALTNAKDEVFGPNPLGKKLACKQIKHIWLTRDTAYHTSDWAYDKRLDRMNIRTIPGAGAFPT